MNICEQVLLAKMAELDGEGAVAEYANVHLQTCDSCRREFEAMREVDSLLRERVRGEAPISVWPEVQARISTPARAFGWHPFAEIGAALVAFKVTEMSLRSDPGLLFGLVPLVLAAALFFLLRENPFRVNAELAMEE